MSMSRLGWADLGLATLNDMRASAETIASLNPSVPLIADADTGYGGPIMVTRTVTQYARSGVAALHIEDQVAWSPLERLVATAERDHRSRRSDADTCSASRLSTGRRIIVVFVQQ